jgi:hypothetical protein
VDWGPDGCARLSVTHAVSWWVGRGGAEPVTPVERGALLYMSVSAESTRWLYTAPKEVSMPR